MKEKIKVSAPCKNPHICYIPIDRNEKIKSIKEKYNLSLYAILCTAAGKSLRTEEEIHKFKKELQKQGFKNIGDWATMLVDKLYEMPKNTDIKQIKISKGIQL